MATKPKAAIDPGRLYRITFSKPITAGNGKKYIPRRGQAVRVSGRVLETIKSEVDTYEAV